MFDFRHRRIRRIFIAMVASLVAGILLTSSYALHLIDKQKTESGLDLTSMQARVFEDYLTQSFNNIDLALRNAPGIGKPDMASDNAFALALRNAPYLRSLSLIGADGIVVASSNRKNIGQHIALDSFTPQVSASNEIMRIGPPWAGRDLHEGHMIASDKPVAADALTFIPVVKNVAIDTHMFTFLAAINSDYFINHFMSLVPPPSGIVEAVRLDGALLFSTQEQQAPGGQADLLPQHAVADRSSGRFLQQMRGHNFLTAYRSSTSFPFVLHVHLDQDVLLAPWQKQMQMILLVISISVLVVVAFSIFIYRRLLQTAQLQLAADEQLKLSAQVFKSSAEAIFIATAEQRIFSVNRAFSEITGYSASEIIGRPPEILCAEQNEGAPPPLWEEIRQSRHWVGEISHRRKNGEIYPAYLTVSCVQDDKGGITHFIGVFSDTTERKVSERFRYLSEHDFLTGLPNRRLFEEHIEQAIARIERYGGRFAIFFLDLDRFKEVNDTFGHHIGDLLLKEVADRLQSCVRSTDILCRQGGDEFLLMIDITDFQEDATLVAQKLIHVLAYPFALEDHTLGITPSIGIALCPDNGLDSRTLIECADIAMYQAKQQGRNNFEFFQPRMGKQA